VGVQFGDLERKGKKGIVLVGCCVVALVGIQLGDLETKRQKRIVLVGSSVVELGACNLVIWKEKGRKRIVLVGSSVVQLMSVQFGDLERKRQKAHCTCWQQCGRIGGYTTW